MILCPRRCISTSQAFNEIVGRATFAPTRTMLRNGMKRILCRGELSTALSEYSLPGYSSIYAVSAMNCVVAPHMPARVASSLSRPLSTYLPPGYGHTLPVRASNAVAPEISHDKGNHDLECGYACYFNFWPSWAFTKNSSNTRAHHFHRSRHVHPSFFLYHLNFNYLLCFTYPNVPHIG